MRDEEQNRAPSGGENSPADEPADDLDPLSPSVRRLVKAYDVDISAIRGSGPSGRIRVGDVMAALGSRASTGTAGADEREAVPLPGAVEDPLADLVERPLPAPLTGALPTAMPAAIPVPQKRPPATTVFECDVGGVLAHRARERGRGVEIAFAAYFLAAAMDAMRAVPAANASKDTVDVAVHGMREGQPATRIVRGVERLSFEALSSELSSADGADEGEAAGDPATTFAVYDYGAFGSVLAAPTPLAARHVACLGIGRPRRQVVIRNTPSGEEAPRAVALCYVSLSYDPERLAFERANLYLARVVRAIERWQQA